MENSLKSLFASTFIHSVVVSLKSIDGAKTLGGLNYLLRCVDVIKISPAVRNKEVILCYLVRDDA